MTDHQRGDTVLPGHPAVMPNLASFIKEGVTFAQTYCPSPHCCPSRATFFTGLYPSRHGVWNNICNGQSLSSGVKDGTRFWSEDLAAAGYQLDFVGKWHVSVKKSPRDFGWTEHLVSGKAGDRHCRNWKEYEGVAHRPVIDKARGEGEIVRPGYGNYRLYGTPHHTTDEAVTNKAIEILDGAAGKKQPWCLWVGLIGPHDPYLVPQKFLDLYDLKNVPLPPSFQDTLEDKPRIYRRMRQSIFGQLSERETREAIRHFWAYCSYMDDLFGKIMEALEKTGQAENTLVLFCSDHGDYCGDHGLFAKGIPAFRGAYHVPAIIRWPQGASQPGRQVQQFVSLADFGPTFLEAAGLEPPAGLTGASLLQFLKGEIPVKWREEIHTQCNGVELYFTQRSVSTKEFKYVFNGFDDDELYDLRSDPHELVNKARDKDFQKIVQDMCRRMWRFALQEEDTAISEYITVGLAPHGPAEAFSSLPIDKS